MLSPEPLIVIVVPVIEAVTSPLVLKSKFISPPILKLPVSDVFPVTANVLAKVTASPTLNVLDNTAAPVKVVAPVTANVLAKVTASPTLNVLDNTAAPVKVVAPVTANVLAKVTAPPVLNVPAIT